MASNSRESMIPPRTLLVSYLARLYTHKFTTTTGGNLSLIDDDGNLYITPSGGDKAFVPSDDVSVLKKSTWEKRKRRFQYQNMNGVGKGGGGTDVEGKDFEGPRKPSIEWPLHTAVYNVRPGCRAVLHAHSMNLVAFSLASKNTSSTSVSTNGGGREGQMQQQQRRKELDDDDDDRSRSLTNGSIPFGTAMMRMRGEGGLVSTTTRGGGAVEETKTNYDNDDEDHICTRTNHNNNNNNDGYDTRTPDTRCLLSTYQSCGTAVFAPYAIPGSLELADVCAKTLQQNPNATCLILQNHGVMTIGRNLHEAYDRFVSLEYLARSIAFAVPLGVKVRPLPDCILKAVNKRSTSSLLAIASFNEKDYDNRQDEEDDNDDLFPRPIPQCAAAACCCRRNRTVTGLEKEIRTNICKFVHRAYAQNLITSSSGSFSVRMVEDEKAGLWTDELSFLITPTKVDRKNLEPSDVCYVSNDQYCRHDENCTASTSSALSSSSPKRRRIDLSYSLRYHPIHHPQSPERVFPSRAASVHATIYAEHPEITCIMVVQPPYATSFCVTGTEFDASGIPEALIVLNDVKRVPLESVLADRGKEVARILDPSRGVNTVLITGYGLLTVGTGGTSGCLLKTFVQLECCENMCGVYLTAKSRGQPHLLTPSQVRDINDAFNNGH